MQFPPIYFYISQIIPIMVACQENGLKKVVTGFETAPPPPPSLDISTWIYYLPYIALFNNPEPWKMF